MINTSVVVEDNRLVSLILDFLNSRNLHTTMRSLEKESGLVNCGFSDDILFLRELVLDGEWEAILIFAQPFEGIDEFDSKQFRYLVLKQKFMEVLYFKSGFGGSSTSYSIEDLIKCLNQLEQDCPNKTEYSKLCWLLTVPNLPEQPEYRDWNPATARIKCFEQILELLKRVIPVQKNSSNVKKSPRPLTPTKDRLLHLVIKGLCFESCVEYCQLRAINGNLSEDLYFHIKDNILNGPMQESSGNFLSWLRNLSQDAFVTPFEPLNLEVDLKKAKQVRGALFHKSPKRDDAEILSRSLSLSGRPATTDIASHLYALDERGEGKNGNRPRTATTGEVSRSHHEFHYKGIPGKETSSAIGNGFCDSTENKELESERKDLPKNYASLDELHKDIVAGHHPTEPNSQPQPVYSLKEEQQQNVLRQLEAHEKQKLELQRQLMKASASNTARKEDMVASNAHDRQPETSEFLKNLRNEHFVNDDRLQRSPRLSQNTQHQQLKRDYSCLDQENVDPVETANIIPPHHGSLDLQPSGQEIGQHNLNGHVVNEYMTSTPARQTKHKPDNLNIAEPIADHAVPGTIPVTPADQTFPLTPAANGPSQLSVGHWVALSDGSGVLNTSTPKSKRQVMSSTPAPPASPVLSVDGATPRGTLLATGQVVSNLATYYGTGEDYPQPNTGLDPTKDKEQPSQFIQQQAPVKRGPKVNGVRRALAPQAGTKQKSGVNEENRMASTPAQEPQGLSVNTQSMTKVKAAATAGNKSSASPRAPPNGQYVGQEPRDRVQEGAGGRGQQMKNGTTFVVDQGASENHPPPLRRAVEGEIQAGGIIRMHKDSIGENTKDKFLGKDAGAVNMTYRKPSTNTPPHNTTVTMNNGNRVALLEKQRDLLQSSSDIKFYTVATLEDVQAIRAIAFHPSGDLFAIGSNSKTLRVCSSEGLNSLQRIERNATDQPPQPTILFKSNRHHRGSIYCVAWSPTGDIIATGSNDKSIKMTRFDAETCTPTWPGMELAIHNGTIRDLAFVSRASGTPVLVSGGAGDGNIVISDCGTGQTVGQLKGHSGHIMTLFAASDDIIASGSADNTVRLWDMRSQRCIDAVATGDSCVASVCVNSAGNMLASGHEDGSCMIYDITAGRTLQLFKPHTMDCRSVRFSPDNNFLLTGSYDTSIIMMDVRKDLETGMPPYSVVAHHKDKVIQCRWHPHLLAFLSSSADKTASLWAPDC